MGPSTAAAVTGSTQRCSQNPQRPSVYQRRKHGTS
uniref:Uncharacterized protein n=1 Tax=Anguilla anguilla TaxID=7936 RepID=A0A0E9U7R5_ANGAN